MQPLSKSILLLVYKLIRPLFRMNNINFMGNINLISVATIIAYTLINPISLESTSIIKAIYLNILAFND